MVSFRYALEVGKFLYVQRIKGLTPPGDPHFDEDSTARFKERIRRSRFYLEFGSGGSTVMADRLGLETISVENDRFYARAVRSVLSPNSRVEIIDVHVGLTGPWGNPIARKPTSGRLERWSRYSAAPFQRIAERGRFPDFVLVDGRFRRACALETARRALSAGATTTVMFDDYYNPGRDGYHRVEAVLGKPERVGRSAWFEIGDGAARVPTDEEMREANSDPL